MKVAISIPDPIFESAENLAKRLGKSRSVLYAEAVAQYVSEHRSDAVTEKLNAVYAAESSSLDPALEEIQLEVLRKEAW